MPVEFFNFKCMSNEQYINRRNKTTNEELTKLKKSPEYRKWLNKQSSNSDAPIKAVACVALLVLCSFIYYGMRSQASFIPIRESFDVSGQTELQLQSSTTIPNNSNQHQQWMLLFESELQCFQERATIQRELSFISRQFNATRSELELSMSKNVQLGIEVSELQQAISRRSDALTFTTEKATNSFLTLSSSSFSSLNVVQLVCGIIAIFLVSASSLFYSKKLASLNQHVQTFTVQLQEAIFDKETAEQSVSILEYELQRKMKQLDEAKEHNQHLLTAQKSSLQSSQQQPSPRIRAVMLQTPTNAIPTNNNRTNDDNTATSPRTPENSLTPGRELPPPPRQLVERFLQERRAVAIEEDQVQAWLQMEGDFGRLIREVGQLRAAVEGRQADADAIQSLSDALEEQRGLARKAKDALKAVKSAGGVAQLSVV